ncbi:MAG: histidine phosphatase family protein [Rhodospirillales bacterium]|nr:histidine phosphatase family protein [Rhodospirillales bacterium]
MIRHGETQANAARIMAGHLDTPLTQNGRDQAFEAQKVVAALQNKPVAVFHSHLSRARDTARIINKALNAPMHEDPDLAEIHAGELEGAPYENCNPLFNSWPKVKDGEDPNDFFERVKRGKTRALNRFNDPILIVCHGGVMRAFGEIHGVPTPGKFENAHLYEFIPNLENEKFPWAVYDYRLCPKSKRLLKSESKIYQI